MWGEGGGGVGEKREGGGACRPQLPIRLRDRQRTDCHGSVRQDKRQVTVIPVLADLYANIDQEEKKKVEGGGGGGQKETKIDGASLINLTDRQAYSHRLSG